LRAFILIVLALSACGHSGNGSGGGSPSGGGGNPATGTLTLVVTGPGAVRSAALSSDCRSSCAINAAAGFQIHLEAVPDVNASFQGWSGACSGNGACDLTVDRDASIGAAFQAAPPPPPPRTFELRVAVSGSGAGRVVSTPAGIDCRTTCSAAFAAGTSVSLAASADALSRFAGFAGACSGSSCTLSLNGDATVAAGFEQQRYQVIDLGAPPESSYTIASAISPGANFVAGDYFTNRTRRSFIWEGGAMKTIIADSNNLNGYVVTAVNDAGTVAGYCHNCRPGDSVRPFRWRSGNAEFLDTLGGDSTWTAGMNRHGIAVGISQRSVGGPRAVSWSGSGITELGALGTAPTNSSGAYGINSHGVIVGESGNDGAAAHAVRFRSPGAIDDLGTLGGPFSRATAINDAGVIVGMSAFDGSGDFHAFFYDGGRMVDAGTLPGKSHSSLVAINSSGTAVGVSFSPKGESRPVVAGGGRMLDLNTLVDDTPYTIGSASGISEAGDISATGVSKAVTHALLLRPK
jgi:probable HAF family extracellular repeat protein